MPAASHKVSWFSDTDGFLEHSPSRGSLYYKGPAFRKIISVLIWGPPSCIYTYINMYVRYLHMYVKLSKNVEHLKSPTLGDRANK